MRLAVSNLALPGSAGPAEWRALAAAGVRGIEVAPTRLAPWEELTPARLAAFREELAGAGLAIPAIQAIFYGVEGLSLLGPAPAFAALRGQLARAAGIGAAMGAGVAVFGAPRQRARGGLGAEQAFSLGAERFRLLAETAFAEGVRIGLEPVPAAYGNDFLASWQEVLAMVRAVDHPGLAVHLDTACVMLGGGDIAEAVRQSAPWLAHVHAAEPQLGPFEAPVAPHAEALAALRAADYGGWVAIEMLEAGEAPLAAVLRAVRVLCGAGGAGAFEGPAARA